MAAAQAKDPAWFFGVICPIPRKGMRKADYDRQPDTIGSLYKAMKEGDEEARKRLWGFARNWNPEPRTVGDRTYQPTQADHTFREALDAFCDWEEKHGKDTPADTSDAPPEVAYRPPWPSDEPPEHNIDDNEDKDIPF